MVMSFTEIAVDVLMKYFGYTFVLLELDDSYEYCDLKHETGFWYQFAGDISR